MASIKLKLINKQENNRIIDTLEFFSELGIIRGLNIEEKEFMSIFMWSNLNIELADKIEIDYKSVLIDECKISVRNYSDNLYLEYKNIKSLIGLDITYEQLAYEVIIFLLKAKLPLVIDTHVLIRFIMESLYHAEGDYIEHLIYNFNIIYET